MDMSLPAMVEAWNQIFQWFILEPGLRRFFKWRMISWQKALEPFKQIQ